MQQSVNVLTFIAVLVTVGLIPGFSGTTCSAADPTTTANISTYPKPHPISDLAFRTLSGQTVSLKDYRGKVVILHFWSINCPACRLEEPLLEQLKKSMGQSGLEILAVNFVDSAQALTNYVASKQPPFPVLLKGNNGFDLRVVNMGGKTTAFVVNPAQEAILEVPGFPTNYIVDCRGGVVGYSVGPAKWDSSYATSLLQRLLTESKTCGLGNVDGSGRNISMR